MHNLCLKPRATGVRQIHKLHTESPAIHTEGKSVGLWRGIRHNPCIFYVTVIQTKQTQLNFSCKTSIEVPDVFLTG